MELSNMVCILVKWGMGSTFCPSESPITELSSASRKTSLYDDILSQPC